MIYAAITEINFDTAEASVVRSDGTRETVYFSGLKEALEALAKKCVQNRTKRSTLGGIKARAQ